MNELERIVGRIYNVALAAACMAHGLTAAEVPKVHRRLTNKEAPFSLEQTYLDLEEAIEYVKGKRMPQSEDPPRPGYGGYGVID